MSGIVAFAAETLPRVLYSALVTVHAEKAIEIRSIDKLSELKQNILASIPVFERRKRGLLPADSTRNEAPSAMTKLKICRQPLMTACFGTSLMPIPSRTNLI